MISAGEGAKDAKEDKSPALPSLLPNTSFSPSLPTLQLAVDSTSLGAFKTCPRYYFYTILMGYQPKEESPHLTFGLLLHSARERYYHSRSAGEDHEEALRKAVHWTLRATWNKSLSRPWFSTHRAFKIKNRLTLLRSLVWYLDNYQDDPLQTVMLANKKPAIELSFRFDSGYRTAEGDPFLLCGHIDRLATLPGTSITCISDLKTSGHSLGSYWFEQFQPSNQMELYLLAGQVSYRQRITSLIIDGVQVTPTHTEFQRGQVTYVQEQVEEFYQSLGWWLRQMEQCARSGVTQGYEAPSPSAWPMNETSCDKYGGCEFRGICSRGAGSRQKWLDGLYRRRTWDPLVTRGDV